jgi:hypothetical protein
LPQKKVLCGKGGAWVQIKEEVPQAMDYECQQQGLTRGLHKEECAVDPLVKPTSYGCPRCFSHSGVSESHWKEVDPFH